MASTVENILEDILATLEHPENQALMRPHFPLLISHVTHWRNRLNEVHDELWPDLVAQESIEAAP
jgi:galactose-1-phosphate uridylyltransferase